MHKHSLKILQVTQDCPYPPNNGQRVGVWNRTLALHNLGHQVDLIATTRCAPSATDLAVMERVTRRMWTVERLPNWKGLLANQPIQIATRTRLSNTPLSESYDLVLIEGEACIPILDNPNLSTKRVAIRVHNDEVKFFREQARSERSIWKRAYFTLEARRYEKHMDSIHKRADHLCFVSYDEWLAWSSRNADAREKSCWLPPAVQISRLRKNNSQSKRVLFLGTLAFPTNIQAVKWYYRNVHKHLIAIEGYQFVVAGNTLGKDLSPALLEIEKDPRSVVLRNVDDLEPLFASCSVFVSPIQRGAGVKMKVLSAVQAGIPVVSTSVGCEGTGLMHDRDILVADDPESFRDCIRLLLDSQDRRDHLASSAQQHLKDKFDHEKCLQELFLNNLAA